MRRASSSCVSTGRRAKWERTMYSHIVRPWRWSSGRSASPRRRVMRANIAARSSRSASDTTKSYTLTDDMQSHMVYHSLLLPHELVPERRNGMSTLQTLHRCETRTVSIDAAPEVVLDLVADPRSLPVWAPRFARSVRRGERDGRWLVDHGQ